MGGSSGAKTGSKRLKNEWPTKKRIKHFFFSFLLKIGAAVPIISKSHEGGQGSLRHLGGSRELRRLKNAKKIVAKALDGQQYLCPALVGYG